jgi:hypothetical protein
LEENCEIIAVNPIGSESHEARAASLNSFPGRFHLPQSSSRGALREREQRHSVSALYELGHGGEPDSGCA